MEPFYLISIRNNQQKDLFYDDRYAIRNNRNLRFLNAFFSQYVFRHSQSFFDGRSVFHMHVFNHLFRSFRNHDDRKPQEHAHENLSFPLVKDRFVAAAGQDFIHSLLEGRSILQVIVEVFTAVTVRARRYVDDDAAFFYT